MEQSFAPFVDLINEDLMKFTSRPKVQEFLDRTGAKSTDDVIKYGLAEEFFATFEGDLAMVPRMKAQEFLKIMDFTTNPDRAPIGATSATVELGFSPFVAWLFTSRSLSKVQDFLDPAGINALRKTELEESLQGFAPFVALISEDLMKFTSRPKVQEFLDRTGAKSTDDVVKYGFAEEFFATFEGELPMIPREKAKEFLKIGTVVLDAQGMPVR